MESLFNKDAGLRPATLLKTTPTQVFPVNIAKFLRTPVFTENISGGSKRPSITTYLIWNIVNFLENVSLVKRYATSEKGSDIQ